VAVVGGGYAGMAAAAALAEQGVRVTVYESARQLGGRARAVTRHGLVLDNGQHVLVGAYRETIRLIERIGAPPDSLMRLPLQLSFPPHFQLRLRGNLPAPWHLALGLLRAQGLSMPARLRCALFVERCRRRAFRLPADASVAALLREHEQHQDAIRFLWEPLCVAALNTPPERASAQVFLNVLRDALASDRASSDLILPRVDLSRLFPAPAADFVVRQDGAVHLACKVEQINCVGNHFMLTTDRGPMTHDAVIVATQPSRVPAIVGHLEPLGDALKMIAALAYEPIVTVYLNYPRPCRLPFPMLGMSRGFGQWMFDRNQISGQSGLLAVVISAYGRERKLSHEQLGEQVRREVAAMLPALDTPDWVQVIEEKQATFACVPKLRRPDQRTDVAGLYLAGDYTASDYPGTLEAAVRSGLRCAALLSEAS